MLFIGKEFLPMDSQEYLNDSVDGLEEFFNQNLKNSGKSLKVCPVRILDMLMKARCELEYKGVYQKQTFHWSGTGGGIIPRTTVGFLDFFSTSFVPPTSFICSPTLMS